MSPLIAVHASAASLSMFLGAWQLLRRTRGDRPHRLVGRVWVVTMYVTVLTSFFVRQLRPGHFSWIHGLSVLTFCTLSIGLWAALTGRIDLHRGMMRGSYLGLLGAFVGAVVVPSRAVPRLVEHQPLLAGAAALALLAVAAAVVVSLTRATASPR